MMECGLEDVSITAVRRLGYKDTDDLHIEEKLDSIEKVGLNFYCVRASLEKVDLIKCFLYGSVLFLF